MSRYLSHRWALVLCKTCKIQCCATVVMGIKEHLNTMTKILYKNQESTLRTEHGNTEWFNIGRRVRQRCILFLYIFNIYCEAIVRNSMLDELNVRVNVGGQINNLRYADDTAIIATHEEDLRTIYHLQHKDRQMWRSLNTSSPMCLGH
jgi:hypothetical protein